MMRHELTPRLIFTVIAVLTDRIAGTSCHGTTVMVTPTALAEPDRPGV